MAAAGVGGGRWWSCSTWWSASAPTWSRFARLAAFGLTHAALGAGGVGRHDRRCGGAAARRSSPRSCVFLVGNAVAFALEALVAAVQALRLEYYELFSRVFDGEGRPVPALARAAGHGPVDPRALD